MKKYLSLIFVFLLSFVLFGCEEGSSSTTELTLPDLTGMSREQMTEVLDSEGIRYIYKLTNDTIYNEGECDQFVSYNGDLKAGDKIDSNYQVYIYTTPLRITYKVSDKVHLEKDYKGKSFVRDGIGEVTLNRAVDGDTAYFTDIITGDYIKLRFLGIDTPESTREKEAWGKAASKFTRDKLNAADTIVLEAQGERQDCYERYLGFVWVDGVLLNLEIVENCYAPAMINDGPYADYFNDAMMHAKHTGRRFWGEIDPNYDYDRHQFK